MSMWLMIRMERPHFNFACNTISPAGVSILEQNCVTIVRRRVAGGLYRGVDKRISHQVLTLEIAGSSPAPATSRKA